MWGLATHEIFDLHAPAEEHRRTLRAGNLHLSLVVVLERRAVRAKKREASFEVKEPRRPLFRIP
jgi:hypothetical protein